MADDPPRLAVVETLYDVNAADVPVMLRQSADSIDAETEDDDRTRAMIAVHVRHSGQIAIYGWGGTERFMAIGALQAAIVKLCDVVDEHRV